MPCAHRDYCWTSRASGWLGALSCLVLVGCGKSVVGPADGTGERIVMFVRGLTLATGDTTSIGLYWLSGNSVREQTTPTGARSNWSFEPRTTVVSSDPSVADYSGGLVSSRQPGAAWLIAARGASRDSTRIFVLSKSVASAGVLSVAIGPGHTCALDSARLAWCWGDLWNGATGSGYRQRYSRLATPTRVRTGETFVDIDVGTDHSCAVAENGFVYCWGDNRFGQIGSTSELETVPIRVLGVNRARAVSVGGDAACALRDDGTIQCWGVGYRTDAVYSAGSGERFVAVSVGNRHICATSASGPAWCWGANSYGQLGTGDLVTRSSPTRVVLSGRVLQISAGSDFTCAIDDASVAWCWGLGLLGELGQGQISQQPMPARVATETRFTQITAGGGHACALESDGRTQCWGGNLYGALGIGPPIKSDPVATDFMFRVPVAVQSHSRYRKITAGGASTCALEMETARVDCWGSNTTGQLGIGQVSWASGVRYSMRSVPTPIVGLAP